MALRFFLLPSHQEAAAADTSIILGRCQAMSGADLVVWLYFACVRKIQYPQAPMFAIFAHSAASFSFATLVFDKHNQFQLRERVI